jgi:hypothetical protein
MKNLHPFIGDSHCHFDYQREYEVLHLWQQNEPLNLAFRARYLVP